MEKKKDDKKPQQRPKDADRQNAKQEREYRQEKRGEYDPPEKDRTEQNATERFVDIKKEESNKKSEEE